MEKIPCIECTPEIWKYVKPCLIKWNYEISCIGKSNIFSLLVINRGEKLGFCTNLIKERANYNNRELVTNVEEFLERAAKLKGFTYKRKDIMKIHGVDIKPGMVITADNACTYIAFPTKKGIAFANNTNGGWGSILPDSIVEIRALSEGNRIDNGTILWEKPKEIVVTKEEIAKKFGCSVEQLKIVS